LRADGYSEELLSFYEDIEEDYGRVEGSFMGLPEEELLIFPTLL